MSDSDEDDEELVEYFYDLVHRSPDVEDVLQELRESSLLKAWRVDLRCRLLLSSEVDSLLDPNVVDWNDFHLSYLESISKHRGTNKKNAVLRSHDQVDETRWVTRWGKCRRLKITNLEYICVTCSS